MDEIPEALRERTKTKSSRQPLGLMIGVLFSLGVIVLLGGVLFLRPNSQSQVNPTPTVTPSDAPPRVEPSPTPTLEEIENVLGHLPYQEALESALKPITSDGRIRLRKAAAERFTQMQKAARASGIILTPISGFRSVSEQEYLFFKVKEQRGQNATKRAEVSAPPGYSEHHTGYAVDIGDGKTPGTNLSPSFEKTSAFRWLKNNANQYSFELSFPPNNPQGVSYEPWHWRFVGDSPSLETFYKAKNLK